MVYASFCACHTNDRFGSYGIVCTAHLSFVLNMVLCASWKIHLRMITLGTLRFVQVTTCHANLLNQKQDMSHEQANFQNSLFCSCLFSGRITTAINTANDYTDDVLQNGFGTNPVWLIREKVMSASRNNLRTSQSEATLGCGQHINVFKIRSSC